MQITISETNASYWEDTIMPDLGEFKDIVKWIAAIKNGDDYFHPSECYVIYNGECHYIIEAGHVNPNISKIIKEIRTFPEELRMIPNDTMMIQSDSFERELFFNLDRSNPNRH